MNLDSSSSHSPAENTDPEKQELAQARKNASQWAVFWGGLAFVIASIICLVYLLIVQPWKWK